MKLKSIATVIGGIIYFISPIDIIPEAVIPVAGYIDDVFVAWKVIQNIRGVSHSYNEKKGKVFKTLRVMLIVAIVLFWIFLLFLFFIGRE